MSYARPTTLPDALALLSRERRRVVCGGTDCYAEPRLVPAQVDWLDISAIPALRGVAIGADTITIGAATSWLEIAGHAALPPLLRQAARAVGSRQVQVLGTVGGNLCNAAPAADGVPPLMALDARVELTSASGSRELPLRDFVLGRRRTALREGELLVAVRFPRPGDDEGSAFHKFGNRDAMTIAVVSAAVRLAWSPDGVVRSAAVVIGSASEVPVHARGLESALAGCRPDDLAPACAGAALPELAPITDLRASAGLRRELARVMAARACREIVQETRHVQHLD